MKTLPQTLPGTPSPQALFITGTGTDVGKTLVTAALLRGLHTHGNSAHGLKPVQTGCRYDVHGELLAPDVLLYKQACPKGIHKALYTFEPACSPHLATAQNGTSLSAPHLAQEIKESIDSLPPNAFMCVEGSGGIMVPLNEQETFLDMLSLLRLPTLLVCPNQLGAVNHTLLTARALAEQSIPIMGFVLTSPQQPPMDAVTRSIHADNRSILKKLLSIPCLGEIPWLESLAGLDHIPTLPATAQDPSPALFSEGDWDKAALALAPLLEAIHQWSPCSKDNDSNTHA